MTLRLGVLASGAGTNLQSLLDAIAAGHLDAEVRLVACNVEGAPALDRARSAGVPALCLPHGAQASRAAFEQTLIRALREHDAEWVVLAGFMRLLGPDFLAAFPNRIVNVHPALLPAFPGLHAPEQALASGVRVAGCTVHLVDAGTDTGPILAQAAVAVRPEDDPAALHARIQKEERRLLPQVLQWIAEGRLLLDGRHARLQGAFIPDDVLVVPAPGALP